MADPEYPDVAEWGDKDVSGAYAPGTVCDIGGQKVDLSTVPDAIGGAEKPPAKSA